MNFKPSPAAIALIKRFEGFRGKPYYDAVHKPTIGYGSTFYSGGHPVTMKDPEISEAEATALLVFVVDQFAQGVNAVIQHPAVNQNQFDALLCFAYNVGLRRLKESTLLLKVNANPADPTIATEFLKWNRAGKKILAGLTSRRAAESILYFKPIDHV